jgi:hypothetical protein
LAPKLFIIGSGFTNAATQGTAPLNKHLLQSIQKTAPDTWKSLTDLYACEDIEVALTRLDMDILGDTDNIELCTLRKKVEASLSYYFKQFRYNEAIVEKSPWLLKFIRGVFAKNDTVVCLNYDCLLEGLLDRCELWSIFDGYGKCDAIGSVPIEPICSPVTVLKIHGSENFHRDTVIGNQSENCFSFTTDESIFPVSGKARLFCPPGKDAEEAVIAPSFVKVFPYALLCLMQEAMDAAIQAENLILIGCGLRPEDTFLYQLLWRFLGTNKRIFILDPFASDLSRRISTTLEYDISKIVFPINKQLQNGWLCLTSKLFEL